MALTPKAFDILRILVSRAGQTVTKDEFMREVWPDAIVEESNLADNISTLRQLLGDDAREPRYIKTVPKRGYRWVGPSSASSAAPPAAGERRKLPVLAIVLALVVASVLAAIFLSRGRSTPEFQSIAVLPIQPLSAIPEDVHLGLGLTDAVITRLSNARELAVRPTSAILRYAGKPYDSVSAGREQKADAVLEGTIHRDGTHVRVNVSLIRTADGRAVWSGTFDEEYTTLFAIEDSIARKVTDALALRADARQSATRDPQAYMTYLEGRYFWSRMTPEGLARSVTLFHAALRLDPKFALAYAALADSYNAMSLWNFVPPREASPQASLAAQRALQLDPENADAHRALAYTAFRYDWNNDEAERRFRRAVELRPADAATRTFFAEFLVVTKRFAEADQQLRRAAALDPTSLYVSFVRATRFYMMRQYPAAVRELEMIVTADPSFLIAYDLLWASQRELGNHDASIAARLESLQRSGIETAALREIYRGAGLDGYRRAEIGVLVEQSKRAYVPAVFVAMNYALLGEKEQARLWLEKARAERSGWIPEVGVDPVWDSLGK